MHWSQLEIPLRRPGECFDHFLPFATMQQLVLAGEQHQGLTPLAAGLAHPLQVLVLLLPSAYLLVLGLTGEPVEN